MRYKYNEESQQLFVYCHLPQVRQGHVHLKIHPRAVLSKEYLKYIEKLPNLVIFSVAFLGSSLTIVVSALRTAQREPFICSRSFAFRRMGLKGELLLGQV